jgi:ABC-type antimicrobial peptide transport system permease subunit
VTQSFRPGRGRHLRLQTILAIAAVAAAVSLPVILISVGGGVAQHEISQLQDSGYQIVVSAAGEHGIGFAHNYSRQFAALGSVAAASPILSLAIDAYYGGHNATPLLAEGVIPTAFSATLGPDASLFPSPLPLGDPTDTAHFANGSYAGPGTLDVLVSVPFANNFGVSIGSPIVLAPAANRSLGVTYTVTGTFGVPQGTLGLGATAAYAAVLPLSELQQLTGFARTSGPNSTLLDSADTIQVALVSSESTNLAIINQVAKEIQSVVPNYGVSTLSQQASQLQQATAVLTGFYLALSSVGLSVGLVFLALVLLRRVEAQRRTIGIRRALGVPNRAVAFEMVEQGFFLAGSGAVVGVVAGFVAVWFLGRYAGGAVADAAHLAIFDPVTLSALVAGVLGLSILASGVATRAALRINIVEALR